MGVTVKAPGTCGELVQGTLDGQNFLITCPVDLYSVAAVNKQAPADAAGCKTRQAVTATLDYLGISEHRIQVSISSQLPVGKGMASSSADISAACQAVALYFNRMLTPDEIAAIALTIEPTDGIFYPGISMFDHVHGLIRKSLGMPPRLFIAVFDAGGEVDTLLFNSRQDLARLNHEKESLVREAIQLVSRGIAEQDGSLIGRGATLSAVANQAILPKPCLDTFLEITPKFGAVGVNVAHSGTVMGVFFPENNLAAIDPCVQAILDACRDVTYLRTVRLISGGLQIERGLPDETATY